MGRAILGILILGTLFLHGVLAASVESSHDKDRKTNPQAASLTLVTPVTADRWPIGTTQSIKWTTSGGVIPQVWLEWSRAAIGVPWFYIAGPITNPPGGSGEYLWTLPPQVNVTYDPPIPCNGQVRVRDANDLTEDKTSTVCFMTAGSPAFTSINNPVAGAHWFPGLTTNIAWASSGITNVKIEITTITTSWATIVATTPNTGMYQYTVPGNQPTSNYYYIRLSDADNTGNNRQSSFFSISAGTLLAVTAPVHADRWARSSAQMITWTSGGTVTLVKLEYTSCLTCDWVVIVGSTSNTGSFAWTVPFNASVRDTTIIRITDLTPEGSDASISSDQFSVVAGASLLVANGCSIVLFSLFALALQSL